MNVLLLIFLSLDIAHIPYFPFIPSELLELNGRLYKEWNINNNSKIPNSKIPNILILYYHGYDNCPDQIVDFSNDYKQAKQLFGLIVKRNRFTPTYAFKFFSQFKSNFH